MAPPAALLGLAYVAAMFTQAHSSPYWSQPECPDQIQGGWTGTSYENQGPSYQQTLQEMVSETIRCIQQVIQVTKREMVLLLRQLAQDSDCEPPGIDNVTPGIHFPPPDGGYSYDRPQEQLQYPEDQPNDSQNQPPQMQMNHQTQIPQPQYLPVGQPGYYKPPTSLQEPPQVPPQTEAQLLELPQNQPIGPPSYYQPVPIQQMPQEQLQHIPDKVSVYYTDAVSCKQNHGKPDHSRVPTSTAVENRLFFPTTVKPSSVNVESSSSSPLLHVHMVERPITMEETKSPNASSGGVKAQPGAGLTSTNSSSPTNPSNTILLPQTGSGNSFQNAKKDHKYEPEFHRTDIQPMATPNSVNTNEEASTENTLNNNGTKEEDSSIPPNNSSRSNIVNIPLLVHGSPITSPIVSYTTARSINNIDNSAANNFTGPSPMENEVDAIMENITDENETNNKYISSSSTNVSKTPLEQSKANSSAIGFVTTEHNNVSEKGTIISPTGADLIQNTTTITTELNSSIHPDITTEITTEKYNESVESVSTTAIDLSTSPIQLDETDTKNLSIYAIDTKLNNSVHPVTSADTKSATSLPMENEQTLLNYNSNKTTPSSVEYLSSSISTDKSTTSTSSEPESASTQNTVTESNNSSANTTIITRKERL